jgi:tetratricopeptide (TPR) repeat protein
LSDVLTFLLIELDPEVHHAPGQPPGDVVMEAVHAAGGSVGATDSGVVTAVFHLASSAALAAVQVARATAAPPRMALCTGEAAPTGTMLGGAAQRRAVALLRLAHPRQILLTASTAVMASPALPRQAELLDRGVRALDAARAPERVYELRPGSAGAVDMDDDAAASNLEWARRAAHGQVLGRDEPLAALETAWKATLHGERRMVLLSGDGGIGKTTVAAELALRLHAEGALVLYGRWDQEAIAPYQAMREALGTYASACPTPRLRADLDGWGDELSRLLPDVGARVGGVRSPLRGDPEGERLRLFEAIETWLDLLAVRRGLLLVLDDLHWSERSSWLLLDHLRQAPGTAPRMILVTAREGEALDHLLATRGWDESSGDGSPVDHIRLAGLDQAVVAQLVEQTTGHQLGPVDDDLVDWLTTGTAGNPLFVQEVLRSIAGNDDAGAALRAARQVVPGQLADVVHWRLTQLPPATSALLADAAVIGGAFDLDLLASATATPAIALQTPLDDGIRSGLLQPPTQAGGRYSFTHDVVRRALQESRDADAVTSLHRRIAVALANRALEGGDVTAAEVAHHHLLGADYQTIAAAVRWARNAAEAARRETAFETAVSLLQRAVAAHDRFNDIERLLATPSLGSAVDDDLAVACELRLELAEAHDRAGEFTSRDERHRDAAELARRIDRTDLFVRAALGYGGRLPAGAPANPTAQGLLEDALRRMPEEDGRSRALLLSRLAQVRYQDAAYDDRRALCDEAEAIARRLDNPVVLATVLIGRCLTLDGPDDIDDQLRVGAEVTEIGRHIGDPDVTLQGARIRIPALFVTGDHDEARKLAGSFASLAQEVRHPDHIRLSTMWDILWAGIEGPYDDFEAKAESLRRELEKAGHPQAAIIHFGQTFVPRWLHGQLDKAWAVLELMGGVKTELAVLWSMSVWAEAAMGHEADALTHLGELDPREFLARVPRDVMWWPTLTGCAVAASCGEPAWAEVIHDTLLPYAGRNCVAAYTNFFGAADHHLGTLSVALGRYDTAVDRLEQALERHRALGAGGFVALSAAWLAHALTLRANPGDADTAATLTTESTDLAATLGLGGLPRFSG